MKTSRYLLPLLLCFGNSWHKVESGRQATGRPVHTYSIVARDRATGDMGVAVQSHWFSVGTLVTWGEAGTGVVATQSFVDPAYGLLGLALMRAGKTAPQALQGLLKADAHPEVRQVAMLDAQGNISAHTGASCIPEAGHQIEDDFSVQANLMLNEQVWPEMARAFQRSQGDLATRMLAALKAAEAVGGDIRGKQSAALLVVRSESTGQPWKDRLVDLRVEDHPEPLIELQRLLQVHRAYAHMNRGDLAVEKGDPETALKEYQAAERLFPENLEMKFWHAVSLVNMGRLQDSLPLFRTVFQANRNWAALLPRLPGVDLLNADASTLERILREGKPPE